MRSVPPAHSAAIDDENREKILALYRNGSSCTSISISLGIPFTTVYEIVSKEYPSTDVRA
jgi:hypothetical protein